MRSRGFGPGAAPFGYSNDSTTHSRPRASKQNAIGLITPPVGIVLNVVSGVARVPMGAVMRGVSPFLIAQLIVLVLLILIPELVTVPLAWLRGR